MGSREKNWARQGKEAKGEKELWDVKNWRADVEGEMSAKITAI